MSFEEEGAPPRWVVIEDDPPICPQCNEIEPSHLLAMTLSGKKVGDLPVIAESTIQHRKTLITGILSKFVYRFQDCMESFQLRFPEEHGFQMVRVGTTDESGVTIYDFSAVVSCAPARPHSPSTSAADRIVFMIALAEWRAGTVRRGPPPAARHDCRDGVAAGQIPAPYNRRTFRGCRWFYRSLVTERLP